MANKCVKKTVICLAALCALLSGCAQDKPTLALAAAPALERCARVIMARDGGMAPLPVADDAAALYQLQKGACDAALVSGDAALPGGVSRVGRVTAGVLHAVSGVSDIGAWRGGTVALMARQGSDEASLLLGLLESYYIKSGDTRLLYLEPDEMETVLDDGRADAALLIAPPGDALVARLLKRGQLCSIPAVKSETLTARFEGLITMTIPADAYGGESAEATDTLALPAQLVMRADADEATKARMLEAASALALEER